MTASLIMLIAAVGLLGLDALMRDAERAAVRSCMEAQRHAEALERAVRRGRLDLSEEYEGMQRGAARWSERAMSALKIRMCARSAAFELCFALVTLRALGVT